MSEPRRRLAVLTSGSDSPGQNAVVRAVVRMALALGWAPYGIERGFTGLLQGIGEPLNSRSVSNIIGRGGTILGSSRSDLLRSPQGVRQALRSLNEAGIEGLVVIGGDGSMRGAHALSEAGFPTVGVPATIENDVYGTDRAIGVDTALNTALDAIDRIKDTASSHEQAFLIEVAGKRSGYLALMAGIAGGAEMVCIPEVPYTLEQVVAEIAAAYVRGKKHCIVMVAEGAEPHATEMASAMGKRRAETGFEVHLSLLGHIQRGGSPTAYDRFWATRLGAEAVRQLHQGVGGVMVGVLEGRLAVTPLAEVVAHTRGIDAHDYEMAKVLAK